MNQFIRKDICNHNRPSSRGPTHADLNPGLSMDMLTQKQTPCHMLHKIIHHTPRKSYLEEHDGYLCFDTVWLYHVQFNDVEGGKTYTSLYHNFHQTSHKGMKSNRSWFASRVSCSNSTFTTRQDAGPVVSIIFPPARLTASWSPLTSLVANRFCPAAPPTKKETDGWGGFWQTSVPQ